MRLVKKDVVFTSDQARRARRHRDTAKTPFQRLCATDATSQQKREPLEQLRDQTNPRQLHREINDLSGRLFSLPGAKSGVTQNVLRTLSVPIPVPRGVDILVSVI